MSIEVDLYHDRLSMTDGATCEVETVGHSTAFEDAEYGEREVEESWNTEVADWLQVLLSRLVIR